METVGPRKGGLPLFFRCAKLTRKVVCPRFLRVPVFCELQLTDASSGIADTFEDIEALTARCRFADCRHEGEPGCAVAEAIEAGGLDPARLQRWRKLLAEDAFNSASLAERRATERAFGKMVRRVTKATKPRR